MDFTAYCWQNFYRNHTMLDELCLLSERKGGKDSLHGWRQNFVNHVANYSALFKLHLENFKLARILLMA